MERKAFRKGSRIVGSGLVKAITTGLKQTERRTRRRKLYCGDAAYCPRRATLFAHTEGKSEFNAASQFYMNTGTVVHELIQEALDKVGMLVEAEQRIDVEIEGVKVAGKIDGVLDMDGNIKILEIKTCGSLPSKPKPEHMHQALVYSLLSDIGTVIIAYMSRKIASWDGKLEIIEFEYDVNSMQRDMVAELLAYSIVGFNSAKLPPIPTHIKSERDCGFCPFAKICWGAEPISLPKFDDSDEDEVQRVKQLILDRKYDAN